MSGLIISDVARYGVQGAKIVEPKEPTEEYKKLVEEANERIREGRRREAEAWIKAQNYIAL